MQEGIGQGHEVVELRLAAVVQPGVDDDGQDEETSRDEDAIDQVGRSAGRRRVRIGGLRRASSPPALVTPTSVVAGAIYPGHDRATPHDPPRRPRRVLRRGRAARSPRAARQAGHRRRAATSAGVVSAASYEARKFGVHSAMPLREAVPALPGRHLPAGRRPALPAGLARRDGDPPPVHAAGRADLDRRGVPRRDRLARLFGDGEAIARLIKAAVREEVGPDGLGRRRDDEARRQDRVRPAQARRPGRRPRGDEAAFLAPLPISRLWGVGDKTADGAARLRGRTIGDLAAFAPDVVVRRFGKHGGSLVDRAHGIDADPVHDGDPAKSVGHEHTFDVDTSDPEIIERTLLAMADGVAGRLRSRRVRARRSP